MHFVLLYNSILKTPWNQNRRIYLMHVPCFLCYAGVILVHVIPMENVKKIFIKAINQTNQLHDKSQWYNLGC